MTHSTITPDTNPADIRGRYEAGRRYADHKTRSRLTAAQVADHFSVRPDEVSDAIKLARAVDGIAANLGDDAKRLLLSGQPQLTAVRVRTIANYHVDRQRYALDEARANRHSLARPPAGTGVGFDTHDFTEILSRLPRNAGSLRKVADGLLATPTIGWPPADTLDAVLDHAVAVRAHVKEMTRLLAETVPIVCDSPPRRKPSASRRGRRPFHPKRALMDVAAAAGVVEKTAGQMPRVIVDTPPTLTQKAAVLVRLQELDAAAGRLGAVIKAVDHDPESGPAAVPDTYIVFFRLPRPLTGFQVGRLGRFDFPAGVYGYVGSAFGGGGVRKRTHRHLTADKPLKWNVDHLIPHGTPVEVWWSHEGRKVEFAWAEVLAGLPGTSCPAAGFGAADNPAAEAHLVRFARMPSADEFSRRVKDVLDGHSPVYETEVKHWTGHGWPEL
jgi:Uri superfamily endonuclease